MATKVVPRDPAAWARLGKTIREHREKKGLSRRALAEIAGVSEKSIQVAEEGRVPRGRMPQSLQNIERALGWMSGSHASILRNEAFIYLEPAEEEEVRLEEEPAKDFAEVEARPGAQAVFSGHDEELVQSGHLAQDVFMRQAKRYRKLQGLSLDALQERTAESGVELSLDDLKRLEDGTRLLRVAEAKAIAGALGATVQWLLGSGFSDDAPEEMKWPPTAEEMEAEAKALQRRMGDVGARVFAARAQLAAAREREAAARQETEMAMAMLQSAMSTEREMERHYQYLLGRIDSIRAASGEKTVVEFQPVYEEGED